MGLTLWKIAGNYSPFAKFPLAFAHSVRLQKNRYEMAQFIYTMNRVGKVVPPKRIILRDISLSFFPGAKIGVLGLNGSG